MGRDASDNVNLQLLEKEYFHLQSVIEEFDSKSLTIKAWSVTLGAGVVSSGAFTENYILLLVSSVAALLFWIIETYWKAFQYANYHRIGQIEDYLSGKTYEIKVPQIGTAWSTSYHQGGRARFFRILFWPHVALPHGVMCLGCLLVYIILAQVTTG